jgi:Mlc titration factor MtfA (ptsG expression regulator)
VVLNWCGMVFPSVAMISPGVGIVSHAMHPTLDLQNRELSGLPKIEHATRTIHPT